MDRRGIALVLVSVGLVIVLATSQLRTAPSPEKQATPLHSKIAIVNLNQVIKNYNKTIHFQDEFKKVYQTHEAAIVKLTKEVQKKQEVLQHYEKEELAKEMVEKEITDLQRRIEDAKKEAQKKLSEKELEQMAILYGDVEEEVGKVAKARGLELVLHYNDAFTEADKHNPQNIQRKLTTMACMPVYNMPGMDLSEEIVAQLNARYDTQLEKSK